MELDPALFDSPFALIGHARDEIQEARTRVEDFFGRKPYAKLIDLDPQTGQEIHKVRLTAKIPGKISVVVKDATSNLRDALDHAVFSAAVALTGNATPSNTGFPFARDAAGVEGELNGKRLRGNPPEVRPFLAALNPHETGNPTLWALNQIRNPNTHRIIVPVGTAVMANQSMMRNATINGGIRFGYSDWDAAKNEVEFLRVGRGSHFEYEVNISFGVTFGDIEALRGKEAFSTLDGMVAEVERVVEALKAETARILRERS